MADYLDVVYSVTKKPPTDYPQRLVKHLIDRYGMKEGDRFLEPGCGTGNFLAWFKHYGLEVYGCDISPKAGGDLKGVEVKPCDIEGSGLPYPDGFFDVIYSKSLIEHLLKPDSYLKESLRILKPGGLLLTLTPDWEANHKIFYDDPTHRTPFTKVSLERVYEMCGFEKVDVVKFRQLPVVWSYPVLNYLCDAISPFTPVRTRNKFLRWSRELMLMAAGRKPTGGKKS